MNDHTLTAKQLADQLARNIKNWSALSAKDELTLKKAKDELVRNFIVDSLINDYAKTVGLIVSDQEVDAELNSVRSNYPDDLSFRKSLAQENISLREWREQIRTTLLAKKVFQIIDEKIIPPNDIELKKYYDENKGRYKFKERVYLQQIVLDDLTKAEAIKAELNKKMDFATLAKKYSVSPEAKSGGNVGWIEKGTVDIFDKAFSLPVGGVSPVLESNYGFHLFKAERKSPAGIATFEEVKPQIKSQLLAKKEQSEFVRWLDAQIRKTRVLKNTELIQNISVETRGQK